MEIKNREDYNRLLELLSQDSAAEGVKHINSLLHYAWEEGFKKGKLQGDKDHWGKGFSAGEKRGYIKGLAVAGEYYE